MKTINYFLTIGVVFLIISCGSTKIRTTSPTETQEQTNVEENAPIASTKTPATVSEYILQFKEVAKYNMRKYRIPASITLAQGILESGAGKSRLCKEAHNHFGIKCHKGWTGGRIYHDDDRAQECFRKYANPAHSYRDHSLFLTSRNRYESLFELNPLDYKSWAKGLKAAGYATDPKYPSKLIKIVEDYNLDSYDKEVMNSGGFYSTMPNLNVSYHIVKKGETLYAISRKYGISVNKIKRWNGLKSDTIDIGQKLRIK